MCLVVYFPWCSFPLEYVVTSLPVSPSPQIRRGGKVLKRGAGAPLKHPKLLSALKGEEGKSH